MHPNLTKSRAARGPAPSEGSAGGCGRSFLGLNTPVRYRGHPTCAEWQLSTRPPPNALDHQHHARPTRHIHVPPVGSTPHPAQTPDPQTACLLSTHPHGSRVPALALCPPHSPQPPPRETLTGTLTQPQRTHPAPCCPGHSVTPWPASLWAVTCPQAGWRGQGFPQAQPRVAAACRPWQESPEVAWARGLPTLARPFCCRQVVRGGLQRGLGPQCLPTCWHHRPCYQDSLREQRPRLGRPDACGSARAWH